MSEPSADEQRELVAALKHDLAKYVAWRSANYGDDAWEGPLSEDFAKAVQDDVLRTKGDAPAWGVWDELSRAFARPFEHRELQVVSTAVEQLRAIESELREGGAALAEQRSVVRDAQQTIRRELRDLHRRLGRV